MVQHNHLDAGVQKLGNYLWNDSELITTKFSSETAAAMSESHEERLTFILCSFNFQFKDF